MRIAQKIHISLPLKNELENIPNVVQCIKNQRFKNFELWVCVNQPDDWWGDIQKMEQCINNQQTINYLESIKDLTIHILDYSSPGKGWNGKKEGIGWARKVLMDTIAQNASEQDIILSMDADTTFGKDYFSSVIQRFEECPKVLGLLNPYHHNLVENEELNRNMLRYEMYMRHYTLNLWQIGSPYAFAAMGSIISCPVWAYRKIGGMTPKKSGEDFYFVQQMVKVGELLRYNQETVYPGTRYSDRVYFGTGPALIKGKNNDWSSYPIYPLELFDAIAKTYSLFPQLFKKDVATPLDVFIAQIFGAKNIWQPLRENYKDVNKFVRACHAKIDGLRILQYLKSNHQQSNETDNRNFKFFIQKYYAQVATSNHLNIEEFSFENLSIKELNSWRDFLFQQEKEFQLNHYQGIKDE